ncbi:hypothetical protein ACFORJ_02685 [Corynebacterium hansenii]|uniref:Transmembrane protein n=1 Tax=Corynebacterium hansenii TaxID=394964 RepID=A0ABV7ZKI8_9CORY|nr:hypothetical protein [Corynebacterium hansenii]WJY99096.1 hypothetical protein CHAN_02325 [Corynebacterium hansenii]
MNGNGKRDRRALASKTLRVGYAIAVGASWLWLPAIALFIRGYLTSGWWVTAFLMWLWAPAFTILNALLMGVVAFRWRSGAHAGFARLAVFVWWFLASLVVILPADFDDQESSPNRLLDWLSTWLPVESLPIDQWMELGIAIAIIAGMWWLVALGAVVTAKRAVAEDAAPEDSAAVTGAG